MNWEDTYDKIREWLAAQQGFVNPITGEGSLPLEGQVWENIQPILAEQERQKEEELVGRAGVSREEAAYAGLPDVSPGSKDHTSRAATESLLGRPLFKKGEKGKEDKEDNFYEQLFLQNLMTEMSGGKPGQAPGVVLGGRSGNLPSMMGQFQRQRKPWWIV